MEKFVKVLAFDICTPKFMGDSYDKDRYDNEQIEYLLKQIMSLHLRDRVFCYDNKMINLLSWGYSEDAEFIEGTFISARYGQVQEIIDVLTQSRTAQKEKNHGLKNEIPFVIDTRNGLILVLQDNQKVVSRDMIHRFFKHHTDLVEGYRGVFNKENSPINIFKNAFVNVATLPSKEFFDEIENFSQINEAYVIADIQAGRNNEAIQYLRNEAEDSGVDNIQQMKIILKNNITKEGIRNIKDFFEKLYNEDRYDGYGINGKTISGREKTLSMAKVPQAFEFKVDFNENGLPSYAQLINGMVNISKNDNPIINKNEGMELVKKVVSLLDEGQREGQAG